MYKKTILSDIRNDYCFYVVNISELRLSFTDLETANENALGAIVSKSDIFSVGINNFYLWNILA